MEFLKSAKRRSFLSESLYIMLNILLAIAVLLVVNASGNIIPGIALVVLSKWRVLAVRPRYWIANLQANLVDFIVSLSFVVFIYKSFDNLVYQVLIAVAYMAWLIFLKPQSKRYLVTIQAGIALAFGFASIMIATSVWPVYIVVTSTWIVGYISARHALSSYGDSHTTQISLIWGFMIAQLGWLGYHWNFAYELPGLEYLKIPQMAVVATIISFATERIYHALYKDKFNLQDIVLPVTFAVFIIFAILIFFNDVVVNV